MKGSLIILAFFITGCLVGQLESVPEWLLDDSLSTYTLYALLFLVGISIGFDAHCLQILRQLHIKVLLVPLVIIGGTCAGAFVAWLLLPSMPLSDVMAVGSGFGYYSLSSIIITNLGNPVLGSIALLSNITREILTLLCTPLLIRVFGKISPIASGGATAMDTTLPIIIKYTSERYGIIAVFSGMFLTVVVPFLVTFIMT
ncbi:MAG: lysine exporter LysO family protein [Desulfovibrionales bacterium]|nr:lysine exporter LysO family protein [Desulfovibrionales bacterium]